MRWYLPRIGQESLYLKARQQEARRMSAREHLRTVLVNLLEEEMGQTYSPPRDDEDLRATLGLDSVDLVGLVMRIEREFHVRLSPEELATMQRVGDLLDLMERKLNEIPGVSPNGAGAASTGGDGTMRT